MLYAAPAAAMYCCEAPAPKSNSSWGLSSLRAGKKSEAVGVSNAARVSRGSEADTYSGVANPAPQRDPTQHGTITVTMYYTVVGGVPSAADVERAVKDLDALYKACPSDKRLVNCTEVTSNVTTRSIATLPPPPKTDYNPFVPTTPSPIAPVVDPRLRVEACCTCKNGHDLTPTYGGESHEPTHGWWCDACGVHVPPGRHPRSVLPKGFGCRQCDFDICRRCSTLPRCTRNHPLLVIKQDKLPVSPEQNGTLTCAGCANRFAVHVAVIRGCQMSPQCAVLYCEGCYLAESMRGR
jgi:hypothetical protein